MELQCIGSFMDASTFQNLHRAGLEDIDFGVNEEMLVLGTEFGLEPYDLLSIVHDKSNTLSRDKVIELLNAGVINIDYISNFDRLCDLGFSITEMLILLNASIPAQNILVYDVFQLYNALGFTSTFKIEYFIENNASPENVYPFIQAGISSEDHWVWVEIPNYIKYEIAPIDIIPFLANGVTSAFEISDFIKNSLTADEVLLFISIGVPFYYPEKMSHYKRHDVSIEQISSFIAIGYSPTSSDIIVKYIENGISADEVASFKAIGIENILYNFWPLSSSDIIIKFIENGMYADEVASFTAIGIKKLEVIVKYKNAGISATEILRTNQITSSLVIMFLISICFEILFFMLVNFEGKLADHELIFEYSSRSFFSFTVVFLLLEFLL